MHVEGENIIMTPRVLSDKERKKKKANKIIWKSGGAKSRERGTREENKMNGSISLSWKKTTEMMKRKKKD